MYKKILVPMALDHGISPQTLEIAKAILAKGGEIIALHVYEMPSGSVASYLDDNMVKAGIDNATAQLNEKVAHLDGVKPVLIKGHTGRSIIDYAETEGVDCIVIGSHKPDIRDYFLGSTASRVVRHAPCAVHVQRTRQ